MVFDHVGVVNRDEDGADRFYRDLLGLDVIRKSSVSPELASKLFSIDDEVGMLVYSRDGLKVEVFVLPGFAPPAPAVPHFCLQVPDLSAFLERAKTEGVKTVSAQRGDHTVHFVEDFSGNRVEVKQQNKG